MKDRRNGIEIEHIHLEGKKDESVAVKAYTMPEIPGLAEGYIPALIGLKGCLCIFSGGAAPDAT